MDILDSKSVESVILRAHYETVSEVRCKNLSYEFK